MMATLDSLIVVLEQVICPAIAGIMVARRIAIKITMRVVVDWAIGVVVGVGSDYIVNFSMGCCWDCRLCWLVVVDVGNDHLSVGRHRLSLEIYIYCSIQVMDWEEVVHNQMCVGRCVVVLYCVVYKW